MRAAAHRQGRRADRRRHADLRRAQHRARRQHDLAVGDVLAGPADRGARRGSPEHPHPVVAAVGVLDLHDRVGSCGQRGARHNPVGGAGRKGGDVRPPGRDVGGDRKRDRAVVRRPGDVRRTHGVAVHRRVVEGGRATSATSGSASTRPRARPSGTSSTGRGPSSSATAARCSSTDRVARAAGANGGVGTGPSCPSVRHRTLG